MQCNGILERRTLEKSCVFQRVLFYQVLHSKSVRPGHFKFLELLNEIGIKLQVPWKMSTASKATQSLLCFIT